MADDRTTAASTDHPDGTLTSHFNIREKSADDGVHSSAMAKDGVTAAPDGSAKVGDKSKMDHAKYPADPTKGHPDHVDDDAPAAGATDEEATKAPGAI